MEIELDVGLINITLPSDLILENEYGWIGTVGGTDRTLGGTLIAWNSSICGGRDIDLVASETRGWISREVANSLYNSLAITTPMILTFTYNDASTSVHNVIWRFADIPVLELAPLISSKVEPGSTDYFTGRIKLLEVSL
jgi:hypothetical protein